MINKKKQIRIACCIGINRYKNIPRASLEYAAPDAKSVAHILAESDFGNFDNVVELLDDKATKVSILDKLREILLKSSLESEDTVLIYFAGHGYLDSSENLSLLPYDTEMLPNGRVDPTTTLHVTDLQLLLDNTEVGTVITILDACHSGASGKILGRLEYNDSVNRIFIGAARFSELAWESPELEHGRFTAHLLTASTLRPTYGEWITLQQTLGYIQNEMNSDSDSLSQTIEVSSHIVDHQIRLFKNPQYALNSEDFVEHVKTLCILSNCEIVDAQPDHIFPNSFVVRELRSFGRYDYTLFVCLNNVIVNITSGELMQISALFKKLHARSEVSSGIVITSKEISVPLLALLPKELSYQTIRGIEQKLINFDKYMNSIVEEFEHGDAERPGHPALRDVYVELNAKPYESNSDTGIPISSTINRWIAEENESMALILSGYGSGKTTFSRKLAYELAFKYKNSTNKIGLRIPILIPMRRFPKFSDWDVDAFIIAHLKMACHVSNPDFDAFQMMNRAGMFVLIFDGFDEMSVGADYFQIQRNFLEIVRLASNQNAKVLITSRPEAFLSKTEESKVLSLLEGGAKMTRLKRLELCPFSSKQLDLFLQKRIPLLNSSDTNNRDWQYFRGQIDTTMGLSELVKRPVLLEITINALPKLIEMGQKITRSALYETYLESEIARQIIQKKRDFLIRNKDARLELAEGIACHLFTKDNRGLNLTALEMQNVLSSAFTSEQRSNLDAYVRDFISCSFMIRNGNDFRFSHLSFAEYLAARAVIREIRMDSPNFMKTGNFTSQTKDFIKEILELSNDEILNWRSKLWEWIDGTRHHDVSEDNYIGGNAITLLAYMGESLRGVDLQNAHLSGAVLDNIDLSEVNFSGSDLRNANLQYAKIINSDLRDVNLSHGNLTGAILTKSRFDNSNLSKTIFTESRLELSQFKHADLEGSELENAMLHGARFYESNLRGSTLTGASINGKTDFNGADCRNARIWSLSLNGKNVRYFQVRKEIEGSHIFKNAKLQGIEYIQPEPVDESYCFVAGTHIKMADGNSKLIEDVGLGDEVLSYCVRTNQIKKSIVHRLVVGDVNSLIVINRVLFTTPAEQLLTVLGWKVAERLKIGDNLITTNGTNKVTSVEHFSRHVSVFNFDVTPYHTFFADGFLVHNAESKPHRIIGG